MFESRKKLKERIRELVLEIESNSDVQAVKNYYISKLADAYRKTQTLEEENGNHKRSLDSIKVQLERNRMHYHNLDICYNELVRENEGFRKCIELKDGQIEKLQNENDILEEENDRLRKELGALKFSKAMADVSVSSKDAARAMVGLSKAIKDFNESLDEKEDSNAGDSTV